MPRISKPTDFDVTVEGVGRFVFGKRTMADEIEIQRQYAEIIGGVTPTAWLETIAGWLSALRVLTVRAPADWDIDDMDPLDEETYVRLHKVYNALIEKERSFRPGRGQAGQAGSAG